MGLVTKQFQGHGKMMYFISMLYETQLVLFKRVINFNVYNNVYNDGIKLKQTKFEYRKMILSIWHGLDLVVLFVRKLSLTRQ